MSKMSQLAMELDEQAVELGFRDREDAMQNGYEVVSDGKFVHLVEIKTEQDKAHEAWLKERDRILHWLEKLSRQLESHKPHGIFGGYLDYEITDMAIDFIKEAHD